MNDPRLHGPPTCPVAPLGCEACSGQHHWIEDGLDPTDADYCTDENLTDQEKLVLAYDREHDTEHVLAYYGCKHCSSWAECEYVWEMEESEEDVL